MNSRVACRWQARASNSARAGAGYFDEHATTLSPLNNPGKSKRISEQETKLLKRRQAIEPIIGHLKADHRMARCHLKGEIGDRLHAVL